MLVTDRLTPEQRSFNMGQVRGRDTKPEMVVRRALHGLGFRFRLHRRDLPGRPDIALPKWKTVVFVHGCFWHGHGCELFRWPATRPEFWKTKIAGNVQRDREAVQRLLADGWRVVTIWECAIKGKARLAPEALAKALGEAIRSDEVSVEVRGHRLHG